MNKSKYIKPAIVVVGGSGIMATQAHAAVVLTDFTTALSDVGTAVTGALGSTVTAGLAIAGVVLGGMVLWRLFKKIASA